MWNKTFPTWAAPFIGTGVAVFMTVEGAIWFNNPITWETILFGVGIGLLAGSLVWFLELVFSSRPVVSQAGEIQEHTSNGEGEFASKFLALLSIIVFIVPLIGLIVGLGATVVNWRRLGWARILPQVGTALSAIVTAAFVIYLGFRP